MNDKYGYEIAYATEHALESHDAHSKVVYLDVMILPAHDLGS